MWEKGNACCGQGRPDRVALAGRGAPRLGRGRRARCAQDVPQQVVHVFQFGSAKGYTKAG